MFPRPACRMGDPDLPHCSPMVRAMGSATVFVNFRPWSRQLDFNTWHLLPCPCLPCCCIHAAAITLGSFTVRVNFRGAGRMGDSIFNCTWVGLGAFTVFAGG
jgi:uncharacterized Zn-binding protein involved in type VI secretion